MAAVVIRTTGATIASIALIALIALIAMGFIELPRTALAGCEGRTAHGFAREDHEN